MRTHPGEVGSSFLLEGLLDYLASDAPLAKRMRAKLIFTVLPMLNIDGVVAGNNRVSPRGINLEGKWYPPDPDVRAAGGDGVDWLDWVAPADLPALVADHDVCLGIFGRGDKALRVVPNKVFQGAASGCAVVTSDTAPQRRALGDCAVLVPPGDPEALADLRAKALAPLSELRPAVAEKLADTLRSWLLHHGRREDVAAALFVHPQTVRYRMNQLRELFGDGLDDPDTVLELTIALSA